MEDDRGVSLPSAATRAPACGRCSASQRTYLPGSPTPLTGMRDAVIILFVGCAAGALVASAIDNRLSPALTAVVVFVDVGHREQSAVLDPHREADRARGKPGTATGREARRRERRRTARVQEFDARLGRALDMADSEDRRARSRAARARSADAERAGRVPARRLESRAPAACRGRERRRRSGVHRRLAAELSRGAARSDDAVPARRRARRVPAARATVRTARARPRAFPSR